MGKNRTKKQKENPHYQSLVSWQPKTSFQARVKRQAKNEPESDLAQLSVKKNVIRSLLIASLIFSLELVVYLAWL